MPFYKLNEAIHIGQIVVLFCFGHGVTCCHSQQGITSIAEWEVWRFLSHAVEDGRLTQVGAEAVQRYLQDHGWPVCPEEVHQIQGLSNGERTWLIGTAEWTDWVRRHRAWSSSPPSDVSFTWTTVRKFSEGEDALTHEARIRCRQGRGRILIQDSIKWGGSFSGQVDGWKWVFGSHQVGWGHGLTLPRADAFGLALFLGGSEVKLPFAPRGLHHDEMEGGMQGFALERAGASWSHGIAAGRRHVGLMSRFHRAQSWGFSAYSNDEEFRVGLDWTARRNNVDWQMASAWTSKEGLLIRSSWRIAQSTSWVAQLTYEGGGAPWQGQWRAFSTWQHLESGGVVQTRIRLKTMQEWDCRFQGQPTKASLWRWSLWGAPQELMGGLHFRQRTLKASYWAGRDQAGGRAFARRVEGAWGDSEPWQWGMFALDGEGDWRGAYVMIRALDGRVWSRAPRSGRRLGVWVTKRVSSESSWTAQCSWSPSQQETFRCAWRWRWEP